MRMSLFHRLLIRSSYLLLLFAIFANLQSSAHADLIASGNFSSSSGSTGSFIAGSTTFNLTAAEISSVELETNFDFIDDGVEIRINNMSLFLSLETSQFGPMDFQFSAVQPNDINNPWNANSNGLPRLSVFADASGVDFSGAVSEGDTATVTYLPDFDVENFTSLLNVGSNTIEFVNHNGSGGAAISGDFTVSTISVPEPSSMLGLLVLGSTSMLRRRRKAVV